MARAILGTGNDHKWLNLSPRIVAGAENGIASRQAGSGPTIDACKINHLKRDLVLPMALSLFHFAQIDDQGVTS